MNAQRRRARLTIVLVSVLLALVACGAAGALSPSTYSGEPDAQTLVVRFTVPASDGVSVTTEETDTTVTIHAELVEDERPGGDEDVELEVEVPLERALGAREVVDGQGRAIPYV